MIPKSLSNLIDVDVLITILRLAFYSADTEALGLSLTFVQILKHLNVASFINKDRIKQSLLNFLEVPFNIDGTDYMPVQVFNKEAIIKVNV